MKLDNKGVRGYERHMNNYSVKVLGGISKESLITSEQAIESFILQSDKLLDIPETAPIENISQVYYSESFTKTSPQIIPAWKISVDNNNYYVDARNGCLLRE